MSRTRPRRAVMWRHRPETPAVPGDGAQIEPAVWAALWALSDNQRVAVVLVHGYGWTMREVGELLGIGVPTVGTHIRRGLTALRTRLDITATTGGGGRDA